VYSTTATYGGCGGDACCNGHRHGLLSRFRNFCSGLGHRSCGCRTSCHRPTCCQPNVSCCQPKVSCPKPTCETSCCKPRHSLFSGLGCRHARSCNTCNTCQPKHSCNTCNRCRPSLFSGLGCRHARSCGDCNSCKPSLLDRCRGLFHRNRCSYGCDASTTHYGAPAIQAVPVGPKELIPAPKGHPGDLPVKEILPAPTAIETNEESPLPLEIETAPATIPAEETIVPEDGIPSLKLPG
jgi:hypothetical protein